MRCALTAPFHHCLFTGCIFSVALSLKSPWPGVTRHHVSVELGLSFLSKMIARLLDPLEKYYKINKDKMKAKKVNQLSKTHHEQLLWWYVTQGCGQFWNLEEQNATFLPVDTPAPMQADSLDQLQSSLSALSCPLKDSAQKTVFSDGNPRSRLMIIGEAPGADEDQQGKPFVGMSGQLLNLMLKSIKIERSDVYITNIVPWRPPMNRQPTAEEIALFLPFVRKHIALIQPDVLLLVGSVSCKAVLQKKEAISFLQRISLTYELPEKAASIPCLAVYHPAYLLRSPGQKKVAWHQMLKLKTLLGKDPLIRSCLA
jgi:uracil-DNA glycosylase family 4